ncbi:anhydro-N-acetylmuramic acid kinase [Jejudonia soesokkakensis]|uniref:Anhydro-N-acetylmuramic acid kinase n=1 Tax=Jejudonia soesokkakensis TaxID=1323432 RepID=A0ABW2MS95_9FLAO
MSQKNYHVIGVMSGTSLDGIDIAECFFSVSENSEWTFKIGSATTIPYSESWKTRLQHAITFSEAELESLNNEYTLYLSEVLKKFMDTHSMKQLDAICSHGHTILHQPQKGITWQIGNLPQLAENVQQTLVCDFRVQDVQLGGQGAPLVPVGDKLLFGTYDYCLNLGGFANCSFEKSGIRIAYDICPVNIVLNFYAEKLGVPYDDGGNIARKASVDKKLLQQLNKLQFYKKSAPKSLGLEWVRTHIFSTLEASSISSEEKIATFTEHIAMQLAMQFEEQSSVFITGGGAYNNFLIERLQFYKDVDIVIPSSEIIEYKEALIFGLLGVLKLRNEINCLASVTGAQRDHSSGVIF